MHDARHRHEHGPGGARRDDGPALDDAPRPARPVDRERRVGPSRRIARTSAASPRAPPRELDPRTTLKALHGERARLHRAVAREAHEDDRRPPAPPREERPLRPVPEREHPRAVAHPLEPGVRHDADAQRRQPHAGDDAERPTRAERETSAPPRGVSP